MTNLPPLKDPDEIGKLFDQAVDEYEASQRARGHSDGLLTVLKVGIVVLAVLWATVIIRAVIHAVQHANVPG